MRQRAHIEQENNPEEEPLKMEKGWADLITGAKTWHAWTTSQECV